MRRFWQFGLAALCVMCVGLLVPYGQLLDLATLASQEFLGNIFSADDSSTSIQARAKDIPVKNLTEMLTYANPEAKAFAAQALGQRAEFAATPALIQALNDTRPFRDRHTKEEASLAGMSRDALVAILKAQINRQPENISVLAQFFTAAERGTPLERKSIVEILGEVKEPLARPLLLDMAKEPDREIGAAAGNAVAKIESQPKEGEASIELAHRQVRMALSAGVLAIFLLASMGYRLVRGANRSLALLSIVPTFLIGGFGAVIASDYLTGEVDSSSIDRAIQNRDLRALRTINYHDRAQYPGDSYVARYLLGRCDEEVIRCLMLLRSVQATDDETVTKLTERRTHWVLSRFIGYSLGSRRLDDVINSKDPQIRMAVASALGGLAVRNDDITAALTRLAGDENEDVRKAAEKYLSGLKQHPIWTSYSADSLEPVRTRGKGRPEL